MAITYNSGENRIYIDNGTYTWEDVKDADDSNGWGVISELAEYMSRCTAKVRVGQGTNTTTLTIREQIIQFDEQIEINSKATLEFGKITDGRPHRGCMIFLNSSETYAILPMGATSAADCKLNVYATKFLVLNSYHNNIGHPTNNWRADYRRMTYERKTASSTLGTVYLGDGSYIDDLMCMNAKDGLYVNDTPGSTNKNIVMHHMDVGIKVDGQTITIRNFDSSSNTTDFYLMGTNPQVNAVDSNITKNLVYHYSSATFNVQNSINYVVQDSSGNNIDGATVVVFDKNDNKQGDEDTTSDGTHDEIIATHTRWTGTGKPPSTETDLTPLSIRIYKYGKRIYSVKTQLGGAIAQTVRLETNDFITETNESTVAGYSGISINHTTETITISSNHTLNEIYDYCQYSAQQDPRNFDAVITTTDGKNFYCEYDFVINDGITVSASDKTLICKGTKTYTLNGSADFTGIIGDQSKRRVPVELTNVVIGSQCGVYRKSDNYEIMNKTASSSTVKSYYEWTTDTDVEIRVRKASGAPKYKPFVGEGTIKNIGLTYYVEQVEDTIVS